jgi:hypothetical protein
MNDKLSARFAIAAPLVASSLLLSGCLSSPTYGTDKTANEQLTSDLSSMFSLKPKTNPVGEYKPRPELVKPASLSELPAPQENIVTADSGQWPESPEQRRARIRADATARQDDPNFQSAVINDISVATPDDLSKLTPKQRSAEIKRRLEEKNQGNAAKRKYLSEPPLTYRQPAETAPVNEIGDDESVKERRIKRMAKKGGGWRDLVPWL